MPRLTDKPRTPLPNQAEFDFDARGVPATPPPALTPEGRARDADKFGALHATDAPRGRGRPAARDRDWSGHPARYRDNDQTWVVGTVEADDGSQISLRIDGNRLLVDLDRSRCEALAPRPPMPDPYMGEPDHVLEIPATDARLVKKWLKRREAKGRARSEALWRSVTPTGVEGLWFILTCFNKRASEASRASLTLVVFRDADGLNTSACAPLHEPQGRRLLYVAGVRKLVEVRCEGDPPPAPTP